MSDERKMELAMQWERNRNASYAAFTARDGAAYVGFAHKASMIALRYAKESCLNGTDDAVAEIRRFLRSWA